MYGRGTYTTGRSVIHIYINITAVYIPRNAVSYTYIVYRPVGRAGSVIFSGTELVVYQ